MGFEQIEELIREGERQPLGHNRYRTAERTLVNRHGVTWAVWVEVNAPYRAISGHRSAQFIAYARPADCPFYCEHRRFAHWQPYRYYVEQPTGWVVAQYPATIGREYESLDVWDAVQQWLDTYTPAWLRAEHDPLPSRSMGQLWEPCSLCNEEPVCAGCMYCSTHCSCADLG